jgi:hypothetical protein
MLIAADNAHLKQRLDRYLWHDDSMPLVHLRRLLNVHFGAFQRVAIIGGLVRDFARRGVSGFRSDVDLVIDAPQQDVASLANRLGAQANRFGGYAYKHPNWKIDFWALETTWAARSGHVNVVTLTDLTKCTFFDWDAVLYDISKKKIIAKDGYFEGLRQNRIEINLLATPSIQGNLLRSVRRLLLWNLEAGPQLKDFISSHLDAESFEAIAKTELSIFPNPVLRLFGNVDALVEQLFSLEHRQRINTSFARQPNLPGVEISGWQLTKGAL